MPQSLHTNFAHIVFSTKNREPMIAGDVAGRIHSYLAGIVQEIEKSAWLLVLEVEFPLSIANCLNFLAPAVEEDFMGRFCASC